MEDDILKSQIISRIIDEANYIIKTKQTLRQLALVFDVSKSTVHKDLRDKLILIDKELATEVNDILLKHKATRHIRGGEATRKKYLKVTK